MAEDDDVIDLTGSNNLTLANHNRLNNIIINLDDISREEENLQSNNRRGTGRKRRHSKTRPADRRVPVQDLCTPDNKLQNKRGSEDSKTESKEIIISEEPKKKKAKTSGSCPICFEDFCDQTLASTKCGHVFCLECLKQALKRERRCPTCRSNLRGKSGYHSLFL